MRMGPRRSMTADCRRAAVRTIRRPHARPSWAERARQRRRRSPQPPPSWAGLTRPSTRTQAAPERAPANDAPSVAIVACAARSNFDRAGVAGSSPAMTEPLRNGARRSCLPQPSWPERVRQGRRRLLHLRPSWAGLTRPSTRTQAAPERATANDAPSVAIAACAWMAGSSPAMTEPLRNGARQSCLPQPSWAGRVRRERRESRPPRRPMPYPPLS